MAVFSKVWRGVPAGKIYPVTYEPGDECPPELEGAAAAADALDGAPEGGKPKAAARGKATAE
ncbi:hypothetical protein WL05_21040 [Burkholderia ubonensis]|uniref:hypothetical protein n=1 Tax=Burkholderia ubonensis TaxID=101571 RepID=UPI0007537D72|nr:hypothetical protein [Burkholderia ubonensis]KVD79860.1 hypothetical protein WI88_20225 [Burkholderia ubonensis]KVX45302.1 hypothetical protein WL05_21040 [Burkholderia ubonensis]KVX73226.1 hypothetical protein WL08_01890 [Burkholderia ubonensis]KWC67201.1 hypothetical protein WL54_03520 [Burkholderia ubonensis]